MTGTDRTLVRLLEHAILLVAGREPERSTEGRGPRVTLHSFRTEPWASATFEGHRHQFILHLSGPEAAADRLAEKLEADLKAEEFELGGTLVADIERTETEKIVDGDGTSALRIHFEALTIEE
ncbi:hypothetical protein B5C34_08730 [Pacificimonas flava]|uniref:DUF3168 domain-containing protein n=2 Tax=Pacificimonas TaxID=1960290 RepID=A0A219B5Z9_9SPHN|nr:MULTISPECIES: hypothetical protein [Pacificimonas]MBZ6379250.1 hypothetical protein [Pacificimonas aurantium]OWV33536.1 hypothetical protein B5C34_08730 [Pacificimonas flava]